jgi:trehalose 6-phosphate phosphatase
MTSADQLRVLLPRAAVLTDFDGTLAPIVDDPAAAIPGPGAVEVLTALRDRARVVGIISGRPIAHLARHVPTDGVHLAGLYGFERLDDGVRVDGLGAERWLEPVAAAYRDLVDVVPSGIRVEPKRLSLTVHYRARPDLAEEVLSLAEGVARGYGLEFRPARASVELHPPEAPDKGDVVEDLAAGCDAACFVGDDVGDAPAFDALDRLAAKGILTVKVAVDSEESEPSLLDRADVVVDGSAGAVDWLRSLL